MQVRSFFPDHFLNQYSAIAMEAALASGKTLNRYLLGRAENFQRLKGRNDLVTAADIESCRVIKRHLKRAFPSHNFLFEEAEFSENNGSDHLWIVDPLDGTTFHNRGLPFFSVLIALQVRKTVKLGVCHCPFTHDFFMSWRGKGSFYGNRRFRFSKPLHVSKTKKLDEAIIGYSYGKNKSQAKEASEIFKSLLPACRALARIGGSDIGYVAAGSCDAFLDNSSTPWDFAAIALLVREAGGRVTDFTGREWNLNSKTILASNKVLHSQILELINE